MQADIMNYILLCVEEKQTLACPGAGASLDLFLAWRFCEKHVFLTIISKTMNHDPTASQH